MSRDDAAARQPDIGIGDLLPVRDLDRRSGPQRAPLAEGRVDEACLRCGDRVGGGGQSSYVVATLLIGRGGAGPPPAGDNDTRAFHRPAGISGEHPSRDDTGPDDLRRPVYVASRTLQASAARSTLAAAAASALGDPAPALRRLGRLLPARLRAEVRGRGHDDEEEEDRVPVKHGLSPV